MKSFFILLAIIASYICFAQSEPSKPVWPIKFSQDFIETFQGKVNHTNVGGYYYDYSTFSTRLIRSNGKYDPFCGGYKKFNETNHVCEHIIVNQHRFIFYPDDNDCCFCCFAEQGCGVLKNDWLKGSNFLGNTTLYGREAYLWVMDEYPDKKNYVWETREENPLNRTLLKIQRSTYNEVFLEETRRLDDFAPIKVPSVCNLNNKCTRGLCAKFRGETIINHI